MACEVGLYYVLHVAKQRNKNALLRLLPGLGECASPALLPPRHPGSCCTLLTDRPPALALLATAPVPPGPLLSVCLLEVVLVQQQEEVSFVLPQMPSALISAC